MVSLTFRIFGDKIVADEPAYLPRAHSILTDQLKSLCLFKKFTPFRNGLKEQGKYLSNILDMIGTMMLFVGATPITGKFKISSDTVNFPFSVARSLRSPTLSIACPIQGDMARPLRGPGAAP